MPSTRRVRRQLTSVAIQAAGGAAAAVSFTGPAAAAPPSLTAAGTGSYSQNFDSLPSSGSVTYADDSTLPGWYVRRTLSVPTTIVADNGSLNGGAIYSYGAAASTDRALGDLGSNAAGDAGFGVQLVNDTGLPITAVRVSYVGEQWRNGGNASAQSLTFAYILNYPTFDTTPVGWAAVPALTFTSPVATAAAAPLDGNAPANRATLASNISLNLSSGTNLWLRWDDPNNTGNDHGLSIDDLKVTYVTAGTSRWTANADGLWSNANNWLGGVPNAAAAVAVFADDITAPRSVTVDNTYDLASLSLNSPVSYTLAGPGTLRFANAASLAVPAGSHTVSARVQLNAPATLAASAGSALTLAGVVAAGGTFAKTGPGTLAIASGADVTVAGDLSLDGPTAISGGSVRALAAETLAGSITQTGGTHSVTGLFALENTAGATASYTLTAGTLNTGPVNIANTAGSAAQVTLDGPGALWQLTPFAAVGVGDGGLAQNASASVSVLNGARFQQDTATDSRVYTGGTAASPGSILVSGAGSQFNVGSGLYLGWSGPAQLTLTDGGSASVQPDPGYTPAPNTLTVGSQGYLVGAGTVHGNVVNAGNLQPYTWAYYYDIPGGYRSQTVTVDGDFTQTPTGFISAEINASPAASTNSRLAVSGQATLAGGYFLSFAPSYVPHGGDVFPLLTASSITGTFDLSSFGLPIDFTADFQYTPTSLTATIVDLGARWSAPVSGSFDDPARWSTAAVPSSSSVPIFDAGPASYTVTFAADHTVNALVVRTGNVTLDLQNHTLSAVPPDPLVTDNFLVADTGSPASLTLLNGSVSLPHSRLLIDTPGTLNIGAGASLTSGYQAVVDGAVNVTGGGHLQLPGTDASQDPGTRGILHIDSGGAVLVSGPASAIDAAGPINVGRNGAGSIRVEAGATVQSAPVSGAGAFDPTVSATIGRSFSTFPGITGTGTGTATVTGAGSAWTQSGALVVGYAGTGTLLIQNGGVVQSASAIVARNPTANGSVSVQGPNSSWQVDGPLSLAGTTSAAGGHAAVALADHASLSVAGDLRLWPNATLSLGAASAAHVAGSLVNAGVIDFAGGSLTLDKHPGFEPAPLVAQLAAAYHAGAWDGPSPLASSAAAADPLHRIAVGYLDSLPTFTLRTTWYGDANLDGRINADDYALLDRGFATHRSTWSDGDFNYDGTVDQQDYLLIDRTATLAAGTYAPSPALLAMRESQFGPAYVAELLTAIPEPSSAACCFAALLPLARRRRTPRGV